ncbi:MAG: heme exporter protein CcmB [Caulobacter sp.]|nr:heme exporter protein CcmB [Caulobacter sp.]
MSPLLVLLRRELALAWGRGGGPLPALAFYAGVTTLLPLAIGPEPERLAVIAPGIAWLALALASLLSLERMFERDFEDGALDLLALGGPGLEAICAVKALAQWLATGLPLAFAAPVAALMLGAPVALAPTVLLCALVGGLAFAFVGGLGAALTLGSRRGGVLIAVIVLPLFAPPVIFGGGALSQAASGIGGTSGLLLLCGWAAAAVALSPLAMAAACRNALD